MKKTIKEKPLITLTELNLGDSVESFAKFLDSQKDLFHSQVNQLQNIVSTQCRLTAVNPLSQEMAAGALAINIGKRPRDLLNPKAVKYMQSVFSIKDTITKKETREISALCGVTVTQVREFFASQRSRVRKHVRLSREKAIKVDTARVLQEGCSTRPDQPLHVTDPTPLNPVDSSAMKSDAEKTLEAGCSISSDAAMPVINPIPLNSMGPKAAGEAPPSSSKEEKVLGADDFEKKFIENIFSLMRKEETFSGQVKLMEWILQIQNSSVLYWFVTKGGLMMLVAWLNEAALEEQTTALLAIFQVLCHLPLHKALPPQMSAILQTVNRLRFYRTSDISNRAKVCLSRWSKIFLRIQAQKKPPSPFGAQRVKNLSQSEILKSEWQSNLDLPEEILSLALDSAESQRTTESPSLMLLQASNDDQNEKNARSVSSGQTKERRKVQLMEQPGRNTNERGPQVTRAMHLNQGRPMSADDIQKAKLRATFMQNKYGKIKPASNEQRQQKTQDLGKSSISQISQPQPPSKPNVGTIKEQHLAKSSASRISHMQSPWKPHVRQKNVADSPKYLTSHISNLPSPSKTQVRHIVEESERPVGLSSETSPTPPDPPLDSKPSSGIEESPLEKLKRDKIPWHLPPEIRMNSEWGVCFGENSKEVEIQTGRMTREKETIYQRIQDIPPNPKEPWDLEMDYDDSLTLQIPTEQAPEEFPAEQVPQSHPKAQATQEFPMEVDLAPQNVVTASVTPATVAPANIASSENVLEPDLELLAVLLKNPELVFALTSGQSGNLSSAETVKLLDMIKNTGGELSRLNGFEEESISLPSPTPHSLPSPTPTSFPSPTPSSERVMEGWRSEVGNNSIQLPVSAANGGAYVLSPPEHRISGASSVQHHSQTTNFRSQSVEFHNQASYRAQLHNEGHWVDNMESTPSVLNHYSNPVQTNRSSAAFNPSQQTFQAASYPQMQPETMSYGQRQEPVHYQQMQEPAHYGQMQTVKPAPISIVMNLPDGTPVTLPPLMQSQQASHFPDNSFPQPMHPPRMQWNAGSSSNMYNQMGGTRGGRQSGYEPSGSNHWSHSNQDNYNSFPVESMQPDGASWDRDELMDEPDYDMNSPAGVHQRSRSPEFRSGRNYSEPRRGRGRNGRQDWSRRRGSGRRDRKQDNRRWRDRRY